MFVVLATDLCIVLQVWQKAGVFFHPGLTNSHRLDPGHLRQLGHVLYPQLSERTWPDIQLHRVAHTGWDSKESLSLSLLRCLPGTKCSSLLAAWQLRVFPSGKLCKVIALCSGRWRKQWVQYGCRQFSHSHTHTLSVQIIHFHGLSPLNAPGPPLGQGLRCWASLPGWATLCWATVWVLASVTPCCRSLPTSYEAGGCCWLLPPSPASSLFQRGGKASADEHYWSVVCPVSRVSCSFDFYTSQHLGDVCAR